MAVRWNRLRPQRQAGFTLFLALWIGSRIAQGQGSAGRPDAPPKPQKGEYTWAEPEDWKPPTLEELQTWGWKDLPVVTMRELARQRSAGSAPPRVSAAEALSMRNDSREANETILSVLGLPPRTDEEVDWEAAVNRREADAPRTLNYVLWGSTVEDDICGLLYAVPGIFDHRFEPMADADIVKRWRRNPMADLIELRGDLVWEDGAPLTAYDYEFAFHVIQDQRIAIPTGHADTLRWVKAYDAQTLAVFHKEPLVTNIWNASFPALPRHIYSPGLAEDPTMRASDWNVYWNLHPLSGGRYRLVEHRSHEQVLLERRDSYYLDRNGRQVRDKPYVKTVRFRIIPDETAAQLAFVKGEIDEKRLQPQQWMRGTEDAEFLRHGVKVHGAEWGFTYFAWAQRPAPDAPFFKDRRVRLAMAYALDHREMIEEIYFGLYDAGTGPFSPESWMADPQAKPFQQDLDKAEALLGEAGWTDSDGDGVRDKTVGARKWDFEFTMSVPQAGSGPQLAVLLKQDLEKIGIRMDIKLLEWTAFLREQEVHASQAWIAAAGAGTDPAYHADLFKSENYPNGRNGVGYSNPQVDELFEKGVREFDFVKRRQIYQRIHKLIAEDQPCMFLVFRRSFWAFGKRLRGYGFSPRGPFGSSPGFLDIWVPRQP
jgi:peptide/nickel transport system substrate-binding protein